MRQRLIDLQYVILTALNGNSADTADAESVLDPASLSEEHATALSQVCKFTPDSAVMVYGSVARRLSDAQSDIDIFVVSPNRHAKGEHRRYREQVSDFDVWQGGSIWVEKMIREKSRDNNNFVLRAFYEGKIVRDLGFQLRTLKGLAREVFDAGPDPLAELVRNRRIGELRLRIAQIDRGLKRPVPPIDAAFMSRTRCDLLIVRAIYTVLCNRRIWTSSLKRTLTICKESVPEVHSMYTDYALVADRNQAAAAAVAVRLGEYAISELSNTTEERKVTYI